MPRVHGDLVWAGVQASIKCRACGGQAPIDGFDVQGPYPCIHCGIDQRMDPAQWSEAMTHAHDVADLAGPGPGAFPAQGDPPTKYSAIGTQYVKAMIDTSYEVFESVPLHVDISPGNPLCEACHAPLAIVSASDPLVVRCTRCGQTRSYVRPAGAPDDLVGIVGHVYEQGIRDVASERDRGGAVAIRCPGCSAPLTDGTLGAAVKCAYCGVICRVGPAMRHAMGSKDARPPRWWALFRGPSAMRLRERAEAQEQAHEAMARAARERHEAEERERERQRQRMREKKQKQNARFITATLSVAMAIAVGASFVIVKRRPQVTPPTANKPPTPASAPSVAKPPAPAGPAFTVEWKGKVTAAKGTSLKRGTPCRAEMAATGASVNSLRVICGDTSLYDSRDPMNGMSSRGGKIIEAPGEHGGHRYLLLYHDIGERTGRSEIQFNSADETTVTSHSPAGLEVTIRFSDLSSERSGPPVFPTTIDTSHALFTAKVTSVEGKAPARTGQSCRLDFFGRGIASDGNVCTAKLDCGRKNLYFTTSYCKLDASGRPAQFSDAQPASHFTLEVAARTAELAGETVDGLYTLTFALEPTT